MHLSLVRLVSVSALLCALSACMDTTNANAVYEADVDRSACSPDYSAYYTANLPVRCTPQTASPYSG